MSESPHYGIKFVLTVALPLLLATLGVVALAQDLLGRVSTGANMADHLRTREIVRSAVETAKQQLTNVLTDNAHWNDAVRRVYAPSPEEWIAKTWGVFTGEGVNYDGAFVVEGGRGTPISGYVRGVPLKPDLAFYFSGRLEHLIDHLPPDMVTPDAKADVIATADGVALVAAGPIVPSTPDLVKLPDGETRYLVFVRFLTDEYLTALGRQYVIGGLLLHRPEHAPRTGALLTGLDGKPVAALSWTDRLPGHAASKEVWRKAILVLSYLGVVMFCVALFCWKLIQRMAMREVEARSSALKDPLTGLPNRIALQEEIGRFSGGSDAQFSIAFLDLDGFKEVNDTYDHETGDRLIRAVAAALKFLVTDSGQAFRLGGDEFVALFVGGDSEGRARSFARSLIDMLSLPIDIDGRMAAVGASVGIVTAETGGVDAQEIMRRADIAMYKAKTSGKNRYCVFVPHFDAERHETLAIADELRRIIAAGTIEIMYQPVVNARTRLITGVEALARWPSSSARRTPPDRFVAVAETCGLIDDLGETILRRACNDARNWSGVQLSVNISPVQLRNANFTSRTLRTVLAADLDPHHVELEITEGTLVDDINRARRVIGKLRDAGFQIALDDFGTGFSSVGYLREFNFDRLKIDRTLIERVTMSSSDQALLQGTMLLASALTSHVTAEGVEREEQVDLLRLTGCTEFQGYLFSKPVSAQDITRMLAAQNAAAAQSRAMSA